MTKNAQQALKYLIQSSSYNVRFCLICNYISKIDISLRNEFICIRFNQLPKPEIYKFIKRVASNENIQLSDDVIGSIQEIYNSDIRSMINFIQLNQRMENWTNSIISNVIWEKLHTLFIQKDSSNTISFIQNASVSYNIDKKALIKKYFNYVIRNHEQYVTPTFLNTVEVLLHSTDIGISKILLYLCHNLYE